jgi:integrase
LIEELATSFSKDILTSKRITSMTKRPYGDGGIDSTGDVHRLRYRINGKRFRKTVHGSATDAKKELRRLIKSGDDGEHIDPSKVTLGKWINDWFVLLDRQQSGGDGARRRGLVGNKTIERYEQLLRGHVVPALGKTLLQAITPSMIDSLYVALEKKARSANRVPSSLDARRLPQGGGAQGVAIEQPGGAR